MQCVIRKMITIYKKRPQMRYIKKFSLKTQWQFCFRNKITLAQVFVVGIVHGGIIPLKQCFPNYFSLLVDPLNGENITFPHN